MAHTPTSRSAIETSQTLHSQSFAATAPGSQLVTAERAEFEIRRSARPALQRPRRSVPSSSSPVMSCPSSPVANLPPRPPRPRPRPAAHQPAQRATPTATATDESTSVSCLHWRRARARRSLAHCTHLLAALLLCVVRSAAADSYRRHRARADAAWGRVEGGRKLNSVAAGGCAAVQRRSGDAMCAREGGVASRCSMRAHRRRVGGATDDGSAVQCRAVQRDRTNGKHSQTIWSPKSTSTLNIHWIRTIPTQRIAKASFYFQLRWNLYSHLIDAAPSNRNSQLALTSQSSVECRGVDRCCCGCAPTCGVRAG